MSSSSDDEIIGAEAEKEFEEEEKTPEVVKKPTPKRIKLTNGQRLKLIDAYRQGKTDKFYNVIPDKKKPGDFRIVKRRKPLDIPIMDNEPIDMTIPTKTKSEIEPVVEKQPDKKEKSDKNKFSLEFYTMQNTINNSSATISRIK